MGLIQRKILALSYQLATQIMIVVKMEHAEAQENVIKIMKIVLPLVFNTMDVA